MEQWSKHWDIWCNGHAWQGRYWVYTGHIRVTFTDCLSVHWKRIKFRFHLENDKWMDSDCILSQGDPQSLGCMLHGEITHMGGWGVGGGGEVKGVPQKGLHLSGTSVVSITREKESNTHVFPKAWLTLQEVNSGTESWQYNLSSPDGD